MYFPMKHKIEKEEILNLIRGIEDEQLKAIVSILYFTGMRLKETLNLKKSDIIFEKKWIRFCLRNRTIIIVKDTQLVRYILNYLDKINKNRRIFTYDRKKVWYELRKHTKRTPRSFRQSKVLELKESGRDAKEITSYLGNSRSFYYECLRGDKE